MDNEDWMLLLLFIVLTILPILAFCYWYARKHGMPYKAVFLLIWEDAIISDAQEIVPTAKAAVRRAWPTIKSLLYAVIAYLRPPPAKYIYTPDLIYGLYDAIKLYTYAPFQPTINIAYGAVPSYIYVSLYGQRAITAETAAEIVWHIQAKYEEYLDCYGLDFQYAPFYYVRDSFIEVYIYYCESITEYPAYRECCHRAMLMATPPTFRPLLEADIPKTQSIVLGYQYEPWQIAGRAVPIVWDMEKAPHLMISGPTGGGKTVFVKTVLEQLLKSGADVTICDFKGYGDLRGFGNAYTAGKDCDALLTSFCANFETTRNQGTPSKQTSVLIFDEFGSFTASKEKKEFDALMRMISPVIFMGRAYGYHIILMSQRFDADTIKTALREQFGIKVYMGPNISQQAATMLFPGSDIDKCERLPPYCGYISTPKVDNAVIITPKIDVQALDLRLKALSK